LDTESWKSQDSSSSGVLESRNPKNPKPEIGTPTKNFADREITPFRSPRYRELKCRNSSSQECRNVESPKCETPKSRNRYINQSFGYREIEKSRVETLQHRSPKVVKCETLKSQNRHTNKELRRLGNNSISESWISGVEVSKHFTTGVSKCLIAEMQNNKIPDL
jgi:hypothetical protein